MKLSEATKRYLEWKGSYAERAAVDYCEPLNKFSIFLQDKDMEETTIQDVSRFQVNLKDKFSSSYIAYIMVVIRNFFEFFRRQGMTCVDPYFIKRPRFITKPHAAVTLEEFQAMDSILREDDFDDLQKKVIIHLGYFSGLRNSELCSMDTSTIGKHARSMIQNRKNKRQRWIFWPESTHELVIKYLGIRIQLGYGNALFISRKNRIRLQPRTLQRWIKEVSGRAKIARRIVFHGFRHSRAHRAKEPGLIKDLLGHSSIVSSETYRHLDPETTEARARATF